MLCDISFSVIVRQSIIAIVIFFTGGRSFFRSLRPKIELAHPIGQVQGTGVGFRVRISERPMQTLRGEGTTSSIDGRHTDESRDNACRMHISGSWILLIFVTVTTALILLLLHLTKLGLLINEQIPDRPHRRLFLASVSFFITFRRRRTFWGIAGNRRMGSAVVSPSG